MKISNVVSNNSIKLLSGLANNEDSLASMVLKDWMGDGATVYTYKKEGGVDDAREKAIEEFGTGAVWLFGIPAIKKVIDKTVYPFLKLDSKFDARILDDKNHLNKINSVLKNSNNSAMGEQKEIFANLNKKNSFFKSFTNAQVYKGLSILKFVVATAVSAVALSKIIKFKQKTTDDRINKELKNNINSAATQNPLLTKSIQKNDKFSSFTSKTKNNNPSFTGGLAEFMYNPIKNTMILDGVITTTRLKEARDGEKKEVAFKELFQIAFIYGLAKPIQKGFEWIGKKVKTPIELDPKVLFTKDIGNKIANSRDSIKKLNNSKNVIETLQELASNNDSIIELLDKDGTISTIKNKEKNIVGVDFRALIDEKAVKNSLEKLNELEKNISKLSKIKAFKTFAVIANVVIAAGIMGIIQPKLNILMRKILNNGDNRNPAIINQEKLAMQGQNSQNN